MRCKPQLLAQLFGFCWIAGSAGCTTSQNSASNQEEAARAIIAAQATSQFAVISTAGNEIIAPTEISIETVHDMGIDLHVWRGIPPQDHWHGYLVVNRGQTMCTGGGFTFPDVNCLAGLFNVNSLESAIEASRAIAQLADPNGAYRLLGAGSLSTESDALAGAAWDRFRPRNWPRDTAFLSVNGPVVRLTMLSQLTRSYAQSWRAIAYDFRYDTAGRLVTWSRRMTEQFLPANENATTTGDMTSQN